MVLSVSGARARLRLMLAECGGLDFGTGRGESWEIECFYVMLDCGVCLHRVSILGFTVASRP